MKRIKITPQNKQIVDKYLSYLLKYGFKPVYNNQHNLIELQSEKPLNLATLLLLEFADSSSISDFFIIPYGLFEDMVDNLKNYVVTLDEICKYLEHGHINFKINIGTSYLNQKYPALLLAFLQILDKNPEQYSKFYNIIPTILKELEKAIKSYENINKLKKILQTILESLGTIIITGQNLYKERAILGFTVRTKAVLEGVKEVIKNALEQFKVNLESNGGKVLTAKEVWDTIPSFIKGTLNKKKQEPSKQTDEDYIKRVIVRPTSEYSEEEKEEQLEGPQETTLQERPKEGQERQSAKKVIVKQNLEDTKEKEDTTEKQSNEEEEKNKTEEKLQENEIVDLEQELEEVAPFKIKPIKNNEGKIVRYCAKFEFKIKRKSRTYTLCSTSKEHLQKIIDIHELLNSLDNVLQSKRVLFKKHQGYVSDKKGISSINNFVEEILGTTDLFKLKELLEKLKRKRELPGFVQNTINKLTDFLNKSVYSIFEKKDIENFKKQLSFHPKHLGSKSIFREFDMTKLPVLRINFEFVKMNNNIEQLIVKDITRLVRNLNASDEINQWSNVQELEGKTDKELINEIAGYLVEILQLRNKLTQELERLVPTHNQNIPPNKLEKEVYSAIDKIAEINNISDEIKYETTNIFTNLLLLTVQLKSLEIELKDAKKNGQTQLEKEIKSKIKELEEQKQKELGKLNQYIEKGAEKVNKRAEELYQREKKQWGNTQKVSQFVGSFVDAFQNYEKYIQKLDAKLFTTNLRGGLLFQYGLIDAVKNLSQRTDLIEYYKAIEDLYEEIIGRQLLLLSYIYNVSEIVLLIDDNLYEIFCLTEYALSWGQNTAHAVGITISTLLKNLSELLSKKEVSIKGILQDLIKYLARDNGVIKVLEKSGKFILKEPNTNTHTESFGKIKDFFNNIVKKVKSFFNKYFSWIDPMKQKLQNLNKQLEVLEDRIYNALTESVVYGVRIRKDKHKYALLTDNKITIAYLPNNNEPIFKKSLNKLPPLKWKPLNEQYYRYFKMKFLLALLDELV